MKGQKAVIPICNKENSDVRVGKWQNIFPRDTMKTTSLGDFQNFTRPSFEADLALCREAELADLQTFLPV